jgi:hypothetical protein
MFAHHPFHVIPGRAEGASPESITRSIKSSAPGLWIPDRRFAASGMTVADAGAAP